MVELMERCMTERRQHSMKLTYDDVDGERDARFEIHGVEFTKDFLSPYLRGDQLRDKNR